MKTYNKEDKYKSINNKYKKVDQKRIYSFYIYGLDDLPCNSFMALVTSEARISPSSTDLTVFPGERKTVPDYALITMEETWDL